MGTPGKHRAKKPPPRGVPFCWNSIHELLIVSGTAAVLAIAWMAVSTGSARTRSAAGVVPVDYELLGPA